MHETKPTQSGHSTIKQIIARICAFYDSIRNLLIKILIWCVFSVIASCVPIIVIMVFDKIGGQHPFHQLGAYISDYFLAIFAIAANLCGSAINAKKRPWCIIVAVLSMVSSLMLYALIYKRPDYIDPPVVPTLFKIFSIALMLNGLLGIWIEYKQHQEETSE